MNVRMLETKEGSPDGIRLKVYKKGEIYDLPNGPHPKPDLGAVFIAEGWAEEVNELPTAEAVDPGTPEASQEPQHAPQPQRGRSRAKNEFSDPAQK